MRGYLLRLFGIFLVVGVGELLLPDGNIKKYAKVVLSILVFYVMLSPIGILPDFDIKTEYEQALLYDTFDEQVKAEYKKRIEESITEKSGYGCEVMLREDNTIERVISYGEISQDAKKYITSELGVLENDIEIRKD